jgi:hypothetical protein
MLTLSAFYEQPWFIIVMLLAIFGAIVLAVILIKRYAPPSNPTISPRATKRSPKKK